MVETVGENRLLKHKVMIDIQNIDFSYKGQHLLYSQFSMRFRQGGIYGLLGKNGSGKSTLLYLISGLLRPKGGTITFDGADTCQRSVEVLRDIFIVPEEFDLPDTTLDQYISMNEPFYPHFSREVAMQCLSDFELPADLRLGKLSMGQKKKVYMSFALAAGTRVLLMDEPTNGLDIPSKSQFRKVVARCMTDDRIIVISTHQVHDVEALLDHVVIVDNGRKALDAAVADVCEKYCFGVRKAGDDMSDVVYAEQALQGCAVVTERKSGDAETELNLELLFDAVAAGKIGMDGAACGCGNCETI